MTLSVLDEANRSYESDLSDSSDQSDRLLPPHGGYRKLRSFQVAQVIYDATVIFCDRFVDKRSRTRDQMIQAARSGVQNIAEGSMASATSKKTELKLTNVARASLEELLLDYEDYLRQRGLRIWDKNSPQALAVRRRYLADNSDAPSAPDPYGVATAAPEVVANTLLCLINQASYLLGRQLQHLEKAFVEHGGFTERLYRARSEQKAKQADGPEPAPTPACPKCGKPMRLRTARKGSNAGQAFWGCSGYPDCTGTRPADQPTPPAQPITPPTPKSRP
jgi:four helix bundle suffix protein